ncbi:hypothetical protein GBAR_LOCUS4633, partial [Geodia barretti]
HLEGRDFKCEDDRNLDHSVSLSFSFEANLASVNDGGYHKMAISVRGVLNRQRYTLPWHFNFRVDLFYCPPLHGVGTPTLATAAPTTAELPTTATTMVPVTSVETTMTPTFTQQPTTQQPTTERPTQRPTTQ